MFLRSKNVASLKIIIALSVVVALEGCSAIEWKGHDTLFSWVSQEEGSVVEKTQNESNHAYSHQPQSHPVLFDNKPDQVSDLKTHDEVTSAPIEPQQATQLSVIESSEIIEGGKAKPEATRFETTGFETISSRTTSSGTTLSETTSTETASSGTTQPVEAIVKVENEKADRNKTSYRPEKALVDSHLTDKTTVHEVKTEVKENQVVDNAIQEQENSIVDDRTIVALNELTQMQPSGIGMKPGMQASYSVDDGAVLTTNNERSDVLEATISPWQPAGRDSYRCAFSTSTFQIESEGYTTQVWFEILEERLLVNATMNLDAELPKVGIQFDNGPLNRLGKVWSPNNLVWEGDLAQVIRQNSAVHLYLGGNELRGRIQDVVISTEDLKQAYSDYKKCRGMASSK